MQLKNIIDELIDTINSIWDLYNKLNNEWNQKYEPLINFSSKKKQINWLYENRDSEEFELISKYWLFLKSNEKIIENQTNLLFRIKNVGSIYDKLEKYYNNKENGKVSLGKCLNDTLGFRKIINFNSQIELFDELNKINDGTLFEKVIINLKTNKYKAIHIYFKKDNNCFPWELQLWLVNDIVNNEQEHLLKYGK